MTSSKYCVLILAANTILFLIAWGAIRFAPESAPVARGAAYAQPGFCIGCHGDPGNLSSDTVDTACSNENTMGYVPGYFGRDFMALTGNGDPDSVRKWIMHGMDTAIVEKTVSGPIANFFFKRQSVSMPSFRSLESEEIELLVHYVTALHQYGPMTAETVRAYGQQSRSNE